MEFSLEIAHKMPSVVYEVTIELTMRRTYGMDRTATSTV